MVAIVLWLVSHRHGQVVDDFNSCVTAGYAVSTTDPQTCSDGHQTYTAPQSSPASLTPTGPTGTNQSYQILAEGDSRDDYPRQQQLITDQAAWVAFWDRLYAKISPLPPLLPVDFGHNEVIALTDGVEPNGGYGLELSGVLAGTSSSLVYFEQITPNAKCEPASGPSDPYVLAVTAKTAGVMSYKPTQQTRRC
jgi:hypothetical protein